MQNMEASWSRMDNIPGRNGDGNAYGYVDVPTGDFDGAYTVFLQFPSRPSTLCKIGKPGSS